jgi:hypothetical protein
MKKQEAQFTTIFNAFLRSGNHSIPSGPMEIKIDDKQKGYISFDDVVEHQLDSLMACTTKSGFVFKIPDLGFTNPFDIFYFRNSPAYVLFAYPKRKDKKTNNWYLFTLTTFLHEKSVNKKKSLTEARAAEICILSDSYRMK